MGNNNYHFLQISGALRRVPSPLQGTSQRTRSNNNEVLPTFSSPPIEIPGKCWASWFVTIRLAVLILLVWWISKLHLCTSTSLAITYLIKKKVTFIQIPTKFYSSCQWIHLHTSPSGSCPVLVNPCIISSNWNVLDPGAAHTAQKSSHPINTIQHKI